MPFADTLPLIQELDSTDMFEIPRYDAQYHIMSSVGEDQDPRIAERAQQIHGMCYVEYGYFDKSGLTDDGRLVPELDGTRSEQDGRRIANYLLASRVGNSVSDASATVRLLDIGDNGTIEDLPTYKYFTDLFNRGINAKLDGIISLYGKKSIREIAALATTDQGEHEGSYELIRAMMQNCILKEVTYDQPELYLASLTDKSLHPVLNFIDYKSAELLGDAVQIFSDDPRSHSIYVTPVLIDLSSVLRNVTESIETAETPRKKAKLQAKLDFLTDGLAPHIVEKYTRGYTQKDA